MKQLLQSALLPSFVLSLGLLAGCGGGSSGEANSGGEAVNAGSGNPDEIEEKVFTFPIRSAGPGSLDPVRGSTTYDNQACSFVYENLLQYKYLVRKGELEPLLCKAMPTVSADGLTYTFELKEGVLFHDDDCFEGGKGREMTAEDVVYSIKRIADNRIGSKNWWLLKSTLAGFDEWRDAQNADGGASFDYDAPCEGIQATGKYTVQFKLTEPVSRFLNILAMFQTSVVPREAAETYGSEFSIRPVGTGPFLMTDWQTSKSLDFVRNPNYREELYPSECGDEDKAAGFDKAAGQRLPIVDRVHIDCFVQDQPMWLNFRSGQLDYAQIPAEYYVESINKRKKTLKPAYAAEGITWTPVPLLDFIFRGFNMEDELLGGDSERSRKLRQAISLAINPVEFNDTFYNSQNVIYDGPIPPGLEGYPKDGVNSKAFRGLNLEEARGLLAEAGYPGGEGLPTIDYFTSKAANSAEQVEMMTRQLGEIGIKLSPTLLEFPQLIETINKKQAPMFSFAWGSDYPDGENNLALFYGPNESPGANHFNYKNAEYDALYEQILTMKRSPERTAIMEQMVDILLEDAPYVGSMARTRNYLARPWLKNFKPTENFWNWPKYVDVDMAMKAEMAGK